MPLCFSRLGKNMHSSTSGFRAFYQAFGGALLALLAIASVETCAYVYRDKLPVLRTNFVTMAYLKKDNIGKYIQEIKMFYTPSLKPRFLQVGDSAGAMGIQPKVIMEHIGQDNTYVSDSCCADMGYKGFRYTAEVMLRKMPQVRYLVLYVTPFTTATYSTTEISNGLAESIDASFLKPWNRLMPPSMALRLPVINAVYYHAFNSRLETNQLNQKESDMYMNGESMIPHMTNWFLGTYGWFERKMWLGDKPNPPTGVCNFSDHFAAGPDGLPKSTNLIAEWNAMAALARRYHVKLLLVFNPVSCERADTDIILDLENRLMIFAKENPDVLIPYPLIRTLPKQYFSDPQHLFKDGSALVSHEFGAYLKNMLDKEGASLLSEKVN